VDGLLGAAAGIGQLALSDRVARLGDRGTVGRFGIGHSHFVEGLRESCPNLER
jgi:hypothetical protein